MPQAIERLFATPKTMPRLPRIRPPVSAIRSLVFGGLASFRLSAAVSVNGTAGVALQAERYRVAVSGDARNSCCFRVLCYQGTCSRTRAMVDFRQSVEAMIPALRRYARALTRDVDIADDLVQDTLVRALRSERLFHGGDIRSWLYTILTNLNRNRRRSLARRPAIAQLNDHDEIGANGTEAEGRDIERALSGLVE